jgi:biopolymer transport protein ExbB/TolQ
VSQILIISMTVFAWGVLLVVMAAQAFLAILLVRENRRLVQGKPVYESLASLNASFIALRKEHLALDELVTSYQARQAVRVKRARKEERERDEENPSPIDEQGIFFPSNEVQ